MSNSENTSAQPSGWKRRKSRRALVQAIYQWQLSGHSLTTLLADFHDGESLKKADVEFFETQLQHVVQGADELDALFEPLLDRPINQLDQIETAVLRLATAELHHRIDVPFKVVIDEYVELTKTFGAQDAWKYINGVLDKLAATERAIEVNHHNATKT